MLTHSSPGDLPHPGTEPASPESPALQEDSLPLSHHGSFPHCSDGKDSAYSTGGTGSIPGREDPLK